MLHPLSQGGLALHLRCENNDVCRTATDVDWGLARMPRIAIIHDWLVTYAGSERVLERLLAVFPDADVFSLIEFLPDSERGFLGGRPVQTSFLQSIPFARRHYTKLLPLMPLAVEQFDLSDYDIVISSSHCVAKGVLTGPNQLHVSYVHSPMRYAWDLQHEYLRNSRVGGGPLGLPTRWLLHKLRMWDVQSANSVDAFAANSQFIARRIHKVYRREARVIHPPVDLEQFTPEGPKEDFYVTASRLVPYKRVRLLVEAFNRMPSRRLVVIGDGPDLGALRPIAGQNVSLVGHKPGHELRSYLQRARAFVFAGLEDFGIALVEAQACGTPVVAFGRGGALETVRGLDHPQPSGLFFDEQTPKAIGEAIYRFECERAAFIAQACRASAERFGHERFERAMLSFVAQHWHAQHRGSKHGEIEDSPNKQAA